MRHRSRGNLRALRAARKNAPGARAGLTKGRTGTLVDISLPVAGWEQVDWRDFLKVTGSNFKEVAPVDLFLPCNR